MYEVPTETTVRELLYTRLELTQSTKKNMKIIQAFRLGRNSFNRNDRTVGPVIVQFSTTTRPS